MRLKCVAVVVLLVAAFGTSVSFAQNEGNGGCVSVVVGSDQKNRGNFDSIFSATQIIDVDFSVLFTPGAARRFADGTHVIDFRIFTPKAHLYQSIAIPVTYDSSRNGKPAVVPGYPRAVPTQMLSATTYQNAQHLRAAARLPVAGTQIVTNSLYGTWSAQVFIDGESKPCSSAATFTITP